MPIITFQVLLIVAAFFLLYGFFNYLRSPERKLRKAKQNKQFFLVDDIENVQKNLRFVYKGCLFEGEKYIGSLEQKFVVTNIDIFVHNSLELEGISKKDLAFLEEEIRHFYPDAHIHWKHPISVLLEK